MQWALSEETLVRLGTEGNLVTVSREAVYNNADFIEKNDVGDGAWLTLCVTPWPIMLCRNTAR